MRKLLLALAVLFVMAGLVVAAEVTLVSYDKEKKTLTVKDGDAEKTYTISDKAKFTSTDKDGKAVEVKFEDFEKKVGGKKGGAKIDIKVENGKEVKLEDFEKAAEKGKGKAKIDVKVEKEEVTDITWKGGKK